MKIKPDTKSEAAVLILFCVFIMSVFTVLILGVSVYENVALSSRPDSEYENRLGLSYIWTKIKSGDEAGMVSLGEFHDIPAIFIDEEYDGITYRTAIYHYDDRIYELFYEVGYEFLPEDGTKIVKSEPLITKDLGDSLLEITAGDESMVIFLRSKG